MKKTILFTFVFLITIHYSLSQNTFFQVKLNQGFHQVVEEGDIYLNQINDSGFNQIISNNGGYIQPMQMSFRFSDENFVEFISVRPFPSMVSNSNILYSQLLEYSTAVNSIYYNSTIADFGTSIDGIAADRLKITLVNSSNGIYTTTIGNIVQTNNAQLNTIFQNFNVDKYENERIRCNCNVNDLKTAVQSLTDVVSSVSDIPFTGAYLNDQEFTKSETIISPNPFDDKFTIKTENKIIAYYVYDNNGKRIVETSSINDLEIKLKSLNSGNYFLNLVFENGQIENKKIIKR